MHRVVKERVLADGFGQWRVPQEIGVNEQQPARMLQGFVRFDGQQLPRSHKHHHARTGESAG